MSELAAVSPLQTQPIRVRERPELAAVTVLQFGPALSVRGGVSTVERLILEQIPQLHSPGAQLSVRQVATMEEGSWWRKGVVFARSLLTLRRAINSAQPLIVHVHFASRGSTLRKLIIAEMASRAGVPVVLHAHGASFDAFFASLPAFLRTTIAGVLQRSRSFIALSSQWRDFYIRECELASGQVTILPNPVRIPAQVPNRRGRRRVQFLFLGRLGARKGAYELLEAFSILDPQLRSRAQLVFAGDGDLEGIARRAEPLRDAVLVLPWLGAQARDQMLAQSDVFVLPSHAEGMPMAMLEAMATGLPVISTPVGGIPDVLRNGEEGLLVEPGDVEGLSLALARMIRDEDRRLKMGQQARARACEYDVDAYAQRLCALYRRIAPVAKVRAFS